MARSKKEIDKDLMYKKLMPTAQNESEAPDATPPAVTPPAVTATDAQAAVATPLAHKAPPAPTQEPVQSAASALVSGVVPEPPSEIINLMELLVEAKLDAAIAKFNCCTCDKCRRDVTAITLNKLVPCYIESTNLKKREEIEATHAGQVATAMVQAILTVKARPTHV